MRQVLIVVTLLASSAIFNPPPILKSLFIFPISAQAEELNKKRTATITSNQNTRFNIVVNIPATEMRVFENDEIIRRLPIAVGQARYPTPQNWETTLTKVIWNPWWIPPKSDWAANAKPTPPGRGNPLGVVKMPLSRAILLHGTNKEWTIGSAASHACIRMFNKDAKNLAWLFQSTLTPYFDTALLEEYANKRWKTVRINLSQPVPVRFIYEPIEFENDIVVLHRDLYGRLGNKKQKLIKKLEEAGIMEEELDQKFLKKVIREWRRGKEAITVALTDLIKNT